MRPELNAEVLLDACDHARMLDRSAFEPLSDLARAEALQIGIAVARLARGERSIGYKIGFTNRAIWPRYGVFHPIWAPVWNTTLLQAVPGADGSPACARIDCNRFVLPRLEPELVVGLRETPAHDEPEAVLAAADWVAHGFEIVQSPFPDWRFSAAEAIAAQGMHAALVLGPKRPLPTLGEAPDRMLEVLARCEVELACDGRSVERGRGENVLGGPMHAIGHLVRELRLRGHSIEAGSLVATGTLTDAQPISPGQCWTTRLSGIDLPGLELRVQ